MAPRDATGPRTHRGARYNRRVSTTNCSACGASLSVYDRACDCGALVHAQAIAELRTRAHIGQLARDYAMALGAYQRALQLVPETHAEHAALSQELAALREVLAASVANQSPRGTARRDLLLLGAVTLALLAWLVWPLLRGTLGASPLHDRHPGSGALYPSP